MNIRMTKQEIDLFRSFIALATSYFEFGMGGSTVAAAQGIKGKLYAVESDQAWINQVSDLIVSSEYERNFIYVDIGPTGKWGVPLSNEKRDQYPNYSGAICGCGHDDFDLCLVDGRFRVACFLQAIRHLRPDAVVGIHDYRRRPAYHIVERFGRPIAEAEDLTFFVRRPGIDMAELQKVLDAVVYRPKR